MSMVDGPGAWFALNGHGSESVGVVGSESVDVVGPESVDVVGPESVDVVGPESVDVVGEHDRGFVSSGYDVL